MHLCCGTTKGPDVSYLQLQLVMGMRFLPSTLGGAVLSIIVALSLGQAQYLYGKYQWHQTILIFNGTFVMFFQDCHQSRLLG